ncbi:hypothetical protein FG386_001287 [Cryptosporidium ryanae]|uniref:uncharacterized protein n=1 Tax=Cryptosporidium ryanae TaxID=515981 RepID=UPI00351A4C70|nr:hypothetical protein FG386_001287 [Cryptosporidium ryanae]
MSYFCNDQLDFELVDLNKAENEKKEGIFGFGNSGQTNCSFVQDKRMKTKEASSSVENIDSNPNSSLDSFLKKRTTSVAKGNDTSSSIESFCENECGNDLNLDCRYVSFDICDSDNLSNFSFTEHLNKDLTANLYKIINQEKINFFNSRIYGLDCVRKLSIIPPIRIHELWRKTPLHIREILYNSFEIVIENRIKVWYAVNEDSSIVNWGEFYLRQIGECLVIPEDFIDRLVRIYLSNFRDPCFGNLANTTPLKEALNDYCLLELQPKLDKVYEESYNYYCYRNNHKNLDPISNYESFLFVRNMSAGNMKYEKNGKTASDKHFLSMSLNDLSREAVFESLDQPRRNTWELDKNANYCGHYSSEDPPNAALILILTLFRLHAIGDILNSRTIAILIDIFHILVDTENDNSYASSLLVFSCLQTLTYNDIKKSKLNENANSLDKGWNKSIRYLKVAGATLLGGVVLAAATTIAAPGIVAGLGTLGVTFSSIIGTTVTAGTSTATLSAMAGVSGAGLSGWKMSRRESPLKIFTFHQINNNVDKNGLFPIIIGISGWLRSNDDIFKPWKVAFNGVDWMENYVIEFEPEILSQLGTSIALTMSQDLAIFAGKAILLQTIVGTLTAALSWPITLMQYAATLDNAWAVTRQKTEQAAILLADALCNKDTTGNRPVKLIGYSMGARLIFLALQILYNRKQFNKVQDVVLLGMPTSLNKKKWRKARSVVSNRFINVFTRSDWVLAFFYRYMQWGLHVAGISPVNFDGIENYDVTGLINSHDEYPDKIRDILYYIKFF